MRKLSVVLAVIFAVNMLAAEWVSGYYRSDGTYVPGYYRSDRDNSYWNNYGSWGNTNPYTGQRGYSLPNSSEYNSNPSYYNYTYRPPQYYYNHSYSSPSYGSSQDGYGSGYYVWVSGYIDSYGYYVPGHYRYVRY